MIPPQRMVPDPVKGILSMASHALSSPSPLTNPHSHPTDVSTSLRSVAIYLDIILNDRALFATLHTYLSSRPNISWSEDTFRNFVTMIREFTLERNRKRDKLLFGNSASVEKKYEFLEFVSQKWDTLEDMMPSWFDREEEDRIAVETMGVLGVIEAFRLRGGS